MKLLLHDPGGFPNEVGLLTWGLVLHAAWVELRLSTSELREQYGPRSWRSRALEERDITTIVLLAEPGDTWKEVPL